MSLQLRDLLVVVVGLVAGQRSEVYSCGVHLHVARGINLAAVV